MIKDVDTLILAELLGEQMERTCTVTVHYHDGSVLEYPNVIDFTNGPGGAEITTIEINHLEVWKYVIPSSEYRYAIAVWDATENIIEAYRPRPVAVKKGAGE